MPDFDVQVLGLSSPLAAAPVTTYTPTISVRNNGLSAAVVTGVLRIYQKDAPGLLLETQQLTPKSIAAGITADVPSALTWTPTTGDIGKGFIFTADITAANDQVETNDHLDPTIVTVVAGAPPPPPPVVTTHAAQHEAGGTDEIHVDGLPGELADDQPAKDHAGKHQQGGADQLSVAGLTGLLTTPQTAASHGNDRHSLAFATATEIATEIDDHDTNNTAHATTTGLEHTAKKGAPNGYAPLDNAETVPFYNIPHDHSVTNIVGFAAAYQGNETGFAQAQHRHRGAGGLCARTLYTCANAETIFMKKAYPAAFFSSAAYYTLDLSIGFLIQATAGDVLTFYVRAAAAAALIGTHAITMPNLGANTPGHLRMLIGLLSGATNAVPHFSSNVRWSTVTPGAIGGANAAGAGTAFAHAAAGDVTVAAKWTGAGACVLQVARLTESCDSVGTNV